MRMRTVVLALLLGLGPTLSALPAEASTCCTGEPPTGYVYVSISNLSISYHGAASALDPCATVVSHVVDFGDGATSTSMIGGHTYTQPGYYTVSLTVVDDSYDVYFTSQTYWISGSDTT